MCTFVLSEDVSSTADIAIDPNKHISGQWKITKAATCVATGISTNYCGRCSKAIDTKTISKDPNNHSNGFTDWKFNNCTSNIQYCKNGCGKSNTQAANNHTTVGGEWKTITDSTCYAKGVKWQYCGHGCGTVVDTKEIGLKAHNLVRVHTHSNDCLTVEHNQPGYPVAHQDDSIWIYTKAEAVAYGPTLANQRSVSGWDFSAVGTPEGAWYYSTPYNSINDSPDRSVAEYPQLAYTAYTHHGDPATDNYYLAVRRFTITFNSHWNGTKWVANRDPSWHISSTNAWVKTPGCGHSANEVYCSNPGCTYKNY